MIDDEVFIGANKTQLRYSINAVQYVNGPLLRGESDLKQTAWWDYKWMHPTEATFYFAHCYVRAVKTAYEKRKGIGQSKYLRPLKPDSFLKNSPAIVTGLWRARQLADKHGIPYDFWCEHAMKYAELFDWRYLPKPTQLYSTKGKGKDKDWYVSMPDFVLAAWEDRNKTRTVHAESSYYKTENFTFPLHPYRAEHQKYLLGLVDNTQNKDILLGTLVFTKGVLLRALAEKRYGKALVKRAEDFAC